jgi:hypothetical protein
MSAERCTRSGTCAASRTLGPLRIGRRSGRTITSRCGMSAASDGQREGPRGHDEPQIDVSGLPFGPDVESFPETFATPSPRIIHRAGTNGAAPHRPGARAVSVVHSPRQPLADLLRIQDDLILVIRSRSRSRRRRREELPHPFLLDAYTLAGAPGTIGSPPGILRVARILQVAPAHPAVPADHVLRGVEGPSSSAVGLPR